MADTALTVEEEYEEMKWSFRGDLTRIQPKEIHFPRGYLHVVIPKPYFLKSIFPLGKMGQ